MRGKRRSVIYNHNKSFIGLGLLLFILSLIVHELAEFGIYRALRGVISFVGAGLLIYFHGKKGLGLLFLFFIFYGISSFLTIGYEKTDYAVISMLFNTVAFLIVLHILRRNINFKKLDWIMALVFLLMSGVLGYLMISYALMLGPFSANNFHYMIIIVNSILAVIMGFFAFLYNHNSSSEKSLMFTGFVFFLIFSEVFRGIGYYEIAFGDLAVFIARILLILSTFVLVKYSLMNETHTIGKDNFE
ncbi:MAG: hypothetical protein HKM28_02870 [Flavobacteriaceae bacterium]|nr:hypothetical protein [Flavobacteriaceae bacterium]